MVKKNNLRKIFAAFACLACATTCVVAFVACDGPEKEGDDASLTVEASLSSGTYWAELEKSTMGSMMTYTVHITLDAEKNTYYFSSYYVMDNQYAHATYVTSESGTYSDNGTEAVFSTTGKDNLTATISDGAFTLDKDVAGMNISTAELTYEKGNAPIYVTYYVGGEEYSKVGYKNATDAVVPIADPDKKDGYTFSWGNVPATAGTGASVNGTYTAESQAKDELISGDYNVDVTWSSMYEYNKALEYHVIIDAEEKTFEVVNQTADSKGSGTVKFEDGVYTLVYTDEKNTDKTTTFTYDIESETITFTSLLWINGIKFNRVDEDSETFVPFTAVKVNEDKIESGDYNVDVTWSSMYEYNKALEYHVIIDAEEKTFEVVNQTADSKGSGTVEFKNGVYTLVYADEKKYR